MPRVFKAGVVSGVNQRRARLARAREQQRDAGFAITRGAPAVFRMARPIKAKKKEVNFVDTALTTLALNTTGTIALLATIAQGAAQTQRIGRKISLKSIQVRGTVFANATTTATTGAWFIVYDRRPTGVLPGITDILVTANSVSLTNSVNVGRFSIIKRMNYALIGNTTTAGENTAVSSFFVDEFIKMKGKPVVFKAVGTGAIGDIEQGALYIIGVGSTAAGTADGDASLAFRTRYWDT